MSMDMVKIWRENDMGIINDIVRRDIKGTPNREMLTTALYELY